MAKIRWEGNEVELVEDWRVGELIEAENALGVNMNDAKGAAQVALVVFISRRRVDKQMPAHVLADQVMRMELSALATDEEEDAGPPADAPADEGGAQDLPSETDGQSTSGSPLTATTSP